MVGNVVGNLDDRVRTKLPACSPLLAPLSSATSGNPTSEKELFGCAEEPMLGFCVGDRVESSDTHDLSDGIPSSVVRVGVCSKYAAQVCLQPELLSSFALLAPLVNAIALHGSREGGVHAHVYSREGIITTKRRIRGKIRIYNL
jgi:hypothetical protein